MYPINRYEHAALSFGYNSFYGLRVHVTHVRRLSLSLCLPPSSDHNILALVLLLLASVFRWQHLINHVSALNEVPLLICMTRSAQPVLFDRNTLCSQNRQKSKGMSDQS